MPLGSDAGKLEAQRKRYFLLLPGQINGTVQQGNGMRYAPLQLSQFSVL